MDRMKNFKAGFIDENPVFGLYLGICSTLAITTTLNSALGMGVSVIAVLVFSNVIISMLRKIIPDEIRIPVYIVVIASLVTIVEMLIHAYSPSLYSALGSFINLIVVNCIIMGRAEAFAGQNNVFDSALDGIGMGLGYTFSLVAMSLIRQILGTGAIGLSNPFTDEVIFNIQIIPSGYEISLFNNNVGAFITFAILAAALAAYKNKKSKEAKQ
ncbi:MAG TPA: electron transporter RnfE [Erysipelotrichaceae bacterium]|jgi:electron transport complex protein RnfE|nr:electron transport complex subunit RsxE [Erysipelotrichaceae bacterium]HCY06745.1 electron transporter RnfE [Erysipelotrichaceae bacterium]